MVTVRCCTFNQVRYIRDCLNGFVMQKTNFRFEAIVHDDASTDGNADIIKEYGENILMSSSLSWKRKTSGQSVMAHWGELWKPILTANILLGVRAMTIG